MSSRSSLQGSIESPLVFTSIHLSSFSTMRAAFAIAAAVSLASMSLAAPTCIAPYVRKEWRELTSAQQTAYITALNCLSDAKLHPHSSSLNPTGFSPDLPAVNTSSSRYDDFVYAHMDTYVKDHFTALFLPWHRWFLQAFEHALRDECSYTDYLPYWDWSLDVANITAAPIFSASSTSGFGGFATSAATNYTITDGAFANVYRAYPTPHIITRHYTPQPWENSSPDLPFTFTDPDKYAVDAIKPSEVTYIINNFTGNFTGFAAYMDGHRAQGMHSAVHALTLPGDLSDVSHSPNDALFWLHHANLDRIWAAWQAKSPANAIAYSGGTVQDLDDYDNYPLGSAPEATLNSTIYTSGLAAENPVVADVMSTTGGYVCYNYSKLTA